ncbi:MULTISPECIES: hypothetical protein [unclassified Nostoc]|uniref:hypothetical protein n=1 Tax=unclassified Nostoc TaxID=2593658 RepID=UPI002AD28FEE|nr:hypothetical protein [Nostoc sp. DedQUE03]MDZ7976755.1 hypothetical protein [Nostoc sp. DedQUE03]MDZ8043219.1 hypothetical protein [Nostoc sp. DedQUE02]
MKSFPLVLFALILGLASCQNIGKSVSKGLFKGPGEAIGETAGKIIGESIVNSLAQKKVSSHSYLLQIASEINKDLPMMVDKETMLINVGAQNDALIYNYTLVNYTSAEVDEYQFLTTMGERLTNSVCTHPETKELLNNGISLHYYYNGNDSIFIGKVIISPSDCR